MSYSSLEGQFGLRLKYNDNDFGNWEEAINNRFSANEKLFNSGYEAGIDYWFRLKKRRIEFMPELAYTRSDTRYEHQTLNQFSLQAISFNFHTHIYALDMEGDCDCPTFSKQGPSINKGLFFHFTPGISWVNTTSEMQSESSFKLESEGTEGILLRVGAGIGLDLGVSDLLTITPILSYYFQSGITWDQLGSTGTDLKNSTVNPRFIQFTLRFGFRPDYRKSSFRR